MIVRGPRLTRDFTILPNSTLRDAALSFRARGLLGFLLSQEPGYRIRSVDLAREATEGRDAVRTVLTELADAGYIERQKRRNDAGEWETDCVVYDQPRRLPGAGEPVPGPTSTDAGHTRDGIPGAGESGAIERTPLEGLEGLSPPTPPRAGGGEVAAVFRAWSQTLDNPTRAKLTPERKRAVQKALRTYPVADLIDAVAGWRLSPHHRGENDAGTVYNDLALILRDAAHIERFRDLTRGVEDRATVAPKVTDMTRRVLAEREARGDGRGDRRGLGLLGGEPTTGGQTHRGGSADLAEGARRVEQGDRSDDGGASGGRGEVLPRPRGVPRALPARSRPAGGQTGGGEGAGGGHRAADPAGPRG